MAAPARHLTESIATRVRAILLRPIITAITSTPILAIGTQVLGFGTNKRAAGSTMTIIPQVQSVVAAQIGKTHQACVAAQVPHQIATTDAAKLGSGP